MTLNRRPQIDLNKSINYTLKMNDKSIEFKTFSLTSKLILNLMIFFISLGFSILSFTVNNNIIISIITFLSVSIILFGYYLKLDKNKVIIKPTEIIHLNGDKKESIDWKDVKTASVIRKIPSNIMSYEIKSQTKTISFPIVSNYKYFQQLLLRYGELEKISEINVPSTFYLGGPKLTRWRKK